MGARYRRASGACATRTFAAVALPDEAPEQVGAVVAVGGLVEGLLGEGMGGVGRGRGLRHGGRGGRAGRARYSCRGAAGRAALSERLSRPTIAARLKPRPRARKPEAPRLRPARRSPRPCAGGRTSRSMKSLIKRAFGRSRNIYLFVNRNYSKSMLTTVRTV